jgi:hypothetical protein
LSISFYCVLMVAFWELHLFGHSSVLFARARVVVEES